MSEFALESQVTARPETVFDVYTDHRAYANLVGLVRAAELEREGEPPPNGLGAIRKLHLVGATVREEVTEYQRPSSYSYRMLSGAPFDQYTSRVTFTPAGRGTAVAYRVCVAPSVRVLPVEFPTKEFIRAFMRKADAEAERID
jgi:Polyketide cyclase / dehydrase and lipid transport